ncbi:TonB-dependent receptor plug domain-containing protein [Hyphococcus luteus]|uniref:TonB-dependent receptor n=1 Tax=Hyphococcus luteus TaxID=2058213 RepID=A0A2S7K063_9PROT|nr:TonB-dependent receptor [Marinicaulis flavus]PQA85894.1 hypothetical protein CW354_20415 [Marinicaulis flavus]
MRLVMCSVVMSCFALMAGAEAQEGRAPSSDLDAFFGPKTELATGYDRPERLAPGVVETITRDEIEALGAISFDEIMQRAAGVVVQKNRVNDPVFTFRGVYNELNPQVLIMIDGSPISDPVAGGRPIAWNMLTPAIERVEIIRGPGSSVFGADAYTGVVNIITKGAVREQLSELGVFGGNFGTIGGYALKTFDVGGARAALTLQGRRTGGDPDQIGLADAQSLADTIFGTTASGAPGRLRTDRSEIAARLNLKPNDSLTIFASYDGFFNTGSAYASTFHVDDFHEFNNHLVSGGFGFRTRAGETRLDVNGRVLWNNLSARTLVAPAGALSPATFALIPFDLRNQFDYESIDARLEAAAVRDVGAHTIRFGAGGVHQRGYDILDRRNFVISPSGLIPAASPDIVDVLSLGQLPNSSGSKRTIGFVSVQDEWRLSPELTLTAGLRFDHYSVFGGTLNPRASLVWAPSLATTVKLLYGAAFRAPTFLEYRTNPGALIAGNPDLEPETIDTYEVEISHRFADEFSASVSGFYFKSEDAIAVINTPTVPTFDNTTGFEGKGVEATFSISPLASLSLKGHYAYQRVTMRDTGMRYADAPAHSAFADLEFKPSEGFRANLIASYVGERARAFGDPRPPLDDYIRTDLRLAWRPPQLQGLEANLAIKNIFDVEYADPTTSYLLAPGDFPREGRSIIGSLSKSF